MKILPIEEAGDHCTGQINGHTADSITKILGFGPNIKDDPVKVKYSWGFTVDGVRCGIWDYKGSYKHKHFSTFGPDETLKAVFGASYS